MAVNFRVLRKEISSQAPKVMARAEPVLNRRFTELKQGLLQDFDAHEVTQEIKRGPTASKSILSYGNLFSLLGFEAGFNPLAPLREYLKKNTYLEQGKGNIETVGGKIYLRKRVVMPTLDEVYAETEQNQIGVDEWADKSWVKMVQEGIPGLPRYLFYRLKGHKTKNLEESSRSGAAVQVEHQIRGGSTPGISYINALLTQFKARIGRKRG